MNPHMANDGFDKALSSNVTDNIFVSKKQFVKHNEYSNNTCETICDHVFANPNNNIEYDQHKTTFKCNSVRNSIFNSIFDNVIQSPIIFNDNSTLAQCTPAADTNINVESFPNNTHSLSLVSSNVHFLPDTPYSSITTYICDACLSYPSSSKTRHCRHTQALQRANQSDA